MYKIVYCTKFLCCFKKCVGAAGWSRRNVLIRRLLIFKIFQSLIPRFPRRRKKQNHSSSGTFCFQSCSYRPLSSYRQYLTLRCKVSRVNIFIELITCTACARLIPTSVELFEKLKKEKKKTVSLSIYQITDKLDSSMYRVSSWNFEKRRGSSCTRWILSIVSLANFSRGDEKLFKIISEIKRTIKCHLCRLHNGYIRMRDFGSRRSELDRK